MSEPQANLNPYLSPTITSSGPLASEQSTTVAPTLWNPRAAFAWSVLFGWAFGAFLLARNWRQLGNGASAKRCMIWFYAFFGWLLLALVIPDTHGTQRLFSGAGIGILVAFWQTEVKPQSEFLKEHFSGQYTHKSWWKPLGIAMGVAVSAVVALVVADSIANSGEDWGTALPINGSDLYYKPPVTEAEAKRLGQYLMSKGFFKTDHSITIQILREENTYEFCLVIKKGLEKDQDNIENYKLFGRELSQDVFNGDRVDVHLCDDHFNTLRVVVP